MPHGGEKINCLEWSFQGGEYKFTPGMFKWQHFNSETPGEAITEKNTKNDIH